MGYAGSPSEPLVCPKTQLPLWEHTVFCSKYSTYACISNPAYKGLIWIRSPSSARHLPALSERQRLKVFCGTAQEETSESPCLTAPKLSTNSNTITPVRGITSGAQVSCVCSPRRILNEN